MDWSAPKRPIQHAEEALITAILDGQFPPGRALPGERDLAANLGVTRPTLREVLRRLESDGWLTIQQGKPTLVNDFWRDGGLNVLSSIVRYSRTLPPDFVPNLLQVRLDFAPSYTRLAVEKAGDEVARVLHEAARLDDTAAAYAAFDWRLQHRLTVLSGNPVYALILNGFAGFYEVLAREYYFVLAEARQVSGVYYAQLRGAAEAEDGTQAAEIAREVMQASIALWRKADEED